MNRKEIVKVTGWLNPVTGEIVRQRIPKAIKQWRYVHQEFPRNVIYFAVPGVNFKEEALIVGHRLLQLQLELKG